MCQKHDMLFFPKNSVFYFCKQNLMFLKVEKKQKLLFKNCVCFNRKAKICKNFRTFVTGESLRPFGYRLNGFVSVNNDNFFNLW